MLKVNNLNKRLGSWTLITPKEKLPVINAEVDRAGSQESATSQNCNHRVWTSAPNHPRGRAGAPPAMKLRSPTAQDWDPSQVWCLTHQFPVHLALRSLLTCYCSGSVSFPLNQRLVPAGMCAFRSFTLDYSTLDDLGQVVNSLWASVSSSSNRDNDSKYFIWFLWELNEIMYVKCLLQHPHVANIQKC